MGSSDLHAFAGMAVQAFDQLPATRAQSSRHVSQVAFETAVLDEVGQRGLLGRRAAAIVKKLGVDEIVAQRLRQDHVAKLDESLLLEKWS